jgi:mono/diheme cytochrome c family protein
MRMSLQPVVLAAMTLLTITATVPRPTGDAARGKPLFQARCISCHKVDGSGGVRLGGNPSPDWRDLKHVAQPAWNDSILRDCITNGRARSGMPAWGRTGQLKPAEIEDLIAHIRTLASQARRGAH